ncbi:MAG: hypothetical protein ACPG4J_10060, partial [Lentibacter algarum]
QLQGNSDTPLSNALEFTKNTFDDRYVESEYFGGRRTQYAPEKHYPAPMPETVSEAIGAFFKKNIKAPVLEGIESMIPMFGLYLGDNREFSEPTIGAALARATPFDIIMDRKIHEAISNLDPEKRPFYELPYYRKEDGTYDERRNDLYEKDVHYTLEHVLGAGGKPIYNVIMLGSGENNQVTQRIEGLQNIDVSEDYANFTNQIKTYEAAERYARARDVVWTDVWENWGLQRGIMSPVPSTAVLTPFTFKGIPFSEIEARIDKLSDTYRKGIQ